MLLELLAGAVSALVAGIAGLLPELDLPDFAGQIGAALGPITSRLSGFGAWVPFSALGAALGVVVASVGAALAIKLIRIIASFLTAGGGSAA